MKMQKWSDEFDYDKGLLITLCNGILPTEIGHTFTNAYNILFPDGLFQLADGI